MEQKQEKNEECRNGCRNFVSKNTITKVTREENAKRLSEDAKGYEKSRASKTKTGRPFEKKREKIKAKCGKKSSDRELQQQKKLRGRIEKAFNKKAQGAMDCIGTEKITGKRERAGCLG